eukprot:TRINITY_DN25311_c0_g1_i1.p1 TRINITY_DN25311_c0_g1~~TRINITY_DN25311_c0_g1_i1.p1  ORF type:complete len:477 (-),score=68.91 TRINITY_DN25311_c0_g1_i1:243-1673(-)
MFCEHGREGVLVVDLLCDGDEEHVPTTHAFASRSSSDSSDAEVVFLGEVASSQASSSSSSGEPPFKRSLSTDAADLMHSCGTVSTGSRRRLSESIDTDDVVITGEIIGQHCSDEAFALALVHQEERAATRRRRLREARDAAMARELALRWEDKAFVRRSESDAEIAKALQMEAGGAQASCRCCNAICWAASFDRSAHCHLQACINKAEQMCDALLDCGHPCCGLRGESSCTFPCCQCGDGRGRTCGVCLDALCESAAIVLACGHFIHMGCAVSMIETADWKGRRIRFAAVRCPAGCGKLLDHPSLAARMAPIHEALAFVEKNVVRRAINDKVLKDGDATSPNVQELLAKYIYFECFKCKQPYCGGLAECEAAGPMKEPAPETVECSSCRMDSQGGACAKHGGEFMAIKCDYCCNEALFRCFGNTMYCTPCHTKLPRKAKVCDPETCPLRGHHPQGRTKSWMMGCAACRGEAANCMG